MSMLSRHGTMIRKKRRSSSKRGSSAPDTPKRTFGSKPPGVPVPVPASSFSSTTEGVIPPISSAPLTPVASPSADEKLPPTNFFQYTTSNSYIPTKSVSCHLEIDLLGNETTKTKLVNESQCLRPGEWSVDIASERSSYGSLFIQIQEANYEADDTCDFVCKTLDIFYSTLPVTLILGIIMMLPLVMIAIGVKYLNECPLEQKVPIYLLVGGCVGLLRHVCVLCRQVRSRHSQKGDQSFSTTEAGDIFQSKSTLFTERIMTLFLIAWFVCGNYWVLRLWQPNYTQLLHDPNNRCDKTVYMFAVCQIGFCYVAFILTVLFILIVMCCRKCCSYS